MNLLEPQTNLFPFLELEKAVKGNNFWENLVKPLTRCKTTGYSVHVGVFVQPFLDYILSGLKTVESRFSVVRCAPYQKVNNGDILLLKLSGGPIVGLCQIKESWFYKLDAQSWNTIRTEFKEALCAEDPSFWNSRENATYATLMQIDNILSIRPLTWKKHDRRGWVVIQHGNNGTLFKDIMDDIILGFSGSPGSGKTEISSAVAKSLNFPWVSFGEQVRETAKLRNLVETRENLQALGETLINKDIKNFCSSVLGQAPWEPGQSLVVDGIRHTEVISEIKILVEPSTFRLIYISIDESIRKKRLARRGFAELTLEEIDKHSTEKQVKDDLSKFADLIIDGSKPLETSIKEILDWLRKNS